jgi:hypothetical protein
MSAMPGWYQTSKPLEFKAIEEFATNRFSAATEAREQRHRRKNVSASAATWNTLQNNLNRFRKSHSNNDINRFYEIADETRLNISNAIIAEHRLYYTPIAA